MALPQGLKTSLNKYREISSDIYQKYIPVIEDNTDIGTFASPILSVPEVYNEFVGALINRIVAEEILFGEYSPNGKLDNIEEELIQKARENVMRRMENKVV